MRWTNISRSPMDTIHRPSDSRSRVKIHVARRQYPLCNPHSRDSNRYGSLDPDFRPHTWYQSVSSLPRSCSPHAPMWDTRQESPHRFQISIRTLSHPHKTNAPSRSSPSLGPALPDAILDSASSQAKQGTSLFLNSSIRNRSPCQGTPDSRHGYHS